MILKTINVMFNIGDKIMLMDGSLGTVEGIVRTEIKTIYRISCLQSGAEQYFEEDKLQLFQRRPVRSIVERIVSLFKSA